jgi:hypothetical protein
MDAIVNHDGLGGFGDGDGDVNGDVNGDAGGCSSMMLVA